MVKDGLGAVCEGIQCLLCHISGINPDTERRESETKRQDIEIIISYLWNPTISKALQRKPFIMLPWEQAGGLTYPWCHLPNLLCLFNFIFICSLFTETWSYYVTHAYLHSISWSPCLNFLNAGITDMYHLSGAILFVWYSVAPDVIH